jgi:hypothetical protein
MKPSRFVPLYREAFDKLVEAERDAEKGDES